MIMHRISKRMWIAIMSLLSFWLLKCSMLTDKNHLLLQSAGGINDMRLLVVRNFIVNYFINYMQNNNKILCDYFTVSFLVSDIIYLIAALICSSVQSSHSPFTACPFVPSFTFGTKTEIPF